jgi:PAS domain S-box-containing protein
MPFPNEHEAVQGLPPANGRPGVFGKSEMANLIRSTDWAKTPLGPIGSWSEVLLAAVNMILASPLPMQLLWGPEFVILYNDGLRDLIGDKHPSALGKAGRDVWEDAWPQVGHQLEGVLLRGEAVHFNDVPIPLVLDGETRLTHWDYSYSPVYASDGAIVGVLDIAQETTETVLARKQQEKLRKSEQHLRLAQDAGAVCSWEIDPATNMLTWTGNTLAVYGRGPEELSTADDAFRHILVEDREPTHRALGPAYSGTGEFHHEFRVVWPDGSIQWVGARGRPVFGEDGRVSRLLGVNGNITARKKAEREKALFTVELEQVLAATSDAVVSVDRDWRMTYFNAKAEELYGPAEQYLQRNLWEAFPLARFEGSPFVEHFEAAMYQGETRGFEAHYAEPLNFWISLSVYPTRSGIALFSRDVSEARKTQAALLQNEKLAAVGRLAASIAHEINNPLESVTNLLYLARGSQEMKEVQEYLDLAERELRRVSVISNQTLRFYKQSTAPRPVTCSELFEGVLSIYQGRIVNSRIAIEKRKRANRAIECFDGEIRQVLNNLIGNAIDAMHPKGGRLIVRSREACNWRTGQQGVALTVADTGTGMSSQVRKKVFDAFYTTKGIGGTGLGLWVSKEIVERHHGSLLVRSSQAEGHSGTVFSVFLPYDAVSRSISQETGLGHLRHDPPA